MQISPEITPLAALLDWYQAMGVDAAVGDAPVDWLAHGQSPPGAGFALARGEGVAEAVPAAAPALHEPQRRAPIERPAPLAPAQRAVAPPPEARQFKPAAPDAAELSARKAAKAATSLAELEVALKSFDGCGLKATAKQLCFYRGAGQARVAVIGEAPGRDEDLEGKPFVGRAGQLLDRMLAAIGLSDTNVHITNIVYWRPPGNRTPTPQEAQVCRPFLERQLELVEPDVLLLLGGAAAKQVLDVADGIMRIRGKWREVDIGGRKVRAMATLHPAYLLRTPAAKRQAWRDLIAVKAHLDGAAS